MGQEKLLIIGAGIGQLPLLEKAKSKGIHVTVVTIPGDYPCIGKADDVIYKDIYDRDGIVEEAAKRKITAVISDQNDLVNPTVAYVANKLCLPGNDFSVVMSYCNKNKFRNICEKVNVPVPRHITVGSVGFDSNTFDCPFPWIVKPADSQSSIGIKQIYRPNELRPSLELALDKSPTHSAIIEGFFFGDEIVCEGFINDGKYYLLAFADRKYFDLPGLFIPSQTLFPSIIDKNILDRIVAYESRLAAYMNPSFAIVHTEYLINQESGEIRMVESALRGGGVYISSDLIPMATGIDINEVLLNKARGMDVDIDAVFEERRDRASAYVCFYLPDGVIDRVQGLEEVKSMRFVRRAYIDDIRVDSHTEPMTYKGARKGPILVQGDSREDLEKKIATVQDMLKISVRCEDGNMKGIVWG